MTEHPDGPPETAARPRSGRVRRLRGRARRSVPFASGILAAFIAVVLYGLLFPPPAPLTTQDVNDTVASALASETPPPAFSQEVYAAIQPSLVLIETSGVAASPSAGGSSAPTSSLGSGVIVDEAGDILTALHVVVRCVDDRRDVRRRDQGARGRPDQRAAERHRGPHRRTPCRARSSRRSSAIRAAIQVGSEAYVVGNPFGLYGSMSAGVVSGLDRSFTTPDTKRTDHRPHPGRRGGQSGQLRRAAPQPRTARSSGSCPPSSIRPSRTSSSASAWPCRSTSPAAPPACRSTDGARTRRPDRRPTTKPREVKPMDRSDSGDRDVPMERVLYEVKKIIVGQDHLLERLVVALLARGHLLVEGVPGLAKTMAIKTLAAADRRRVQAHPVHPRPRPGRPRRHPHLQPEDGRVQHLARARCSPTSSSPTRSTGPRPRSRARCSR